MGGNAQRSNFLELCLLRSFDRAVVYSACFRDALERKAVDLVRSVSFRAPQLGFWRHTHIEGNAGRRFEVWPSSDSYHELRCKHASKCVETVAPSAALCGMLNWSCSPFMTERACRTMWQFSSFSFLYPCILIMFWSSWLFAVQCSVV